MKNLAIVHSRAQSGIEAPPVTVEVHLSSGLPRLSIVGLPETAVKESKERVRSAILNSQFAFPNRHIIINLAPADLPKEGGRFDLPIAIGILAASQQIPGAALSEYEFTGELALSGKLRSVCGTLPFAVATHAAKRRLIAPKQNAKEACLIQGLTVLPAEHLLEVCAHLNGRQLLTAEVAAPRTDRGFDELDLSDVQGQSQAKRALEIAAAGGHNLLFVGPPGTGKTMLASRLPGILPPLSQQEAIELASIYSIRGFKNIGRHFYQRPFRQPHHTGSAIALVGGGSIPRPGEISLAHHGILFLDELAEFERKALEILREPLENGRIAIIRARHIAEFPADFQLIAAMNPCPCGYLGARSRSCACSASQIQRYRHRISGPLLDRIDMQLEVPELPKGSLSHPLPNESSAVIRKRVIAARHRQLQRQAVLNARLCGKALQSYCALGKSEQSLLESACEKLKLSARSYHRIMKMARTIADLDDSNSILAPHLTEALSYRNLETRN